ncbi:hypothetical protein EZS27_041941 [termite gut metagenome]|uniref:Uncharacterized protein n=1 Tax=termite gut metagenome TaxID=433724 RepID=A0A5J4PCZ7_9ZZZZ
MGGCIIKYTVGSCLSVIDIKESQSKIFQVIQQLIRETASLSKSPSDTVPKATIISFYSSISESRSPVNCRKQFLQR